MFKFIHTSDVHLGAKLGWLKDKASLHRRQVYKTFERICEKALSEQVNAIFISGDLFDSPEPDREIFGYVRYQLEELCNHQIHVFLLPGNHDFYTKEGPYGRLKSSSYLHIFTKTKPEVFEIEELKLSVYGQAIRDNKSTPKFDDLVGLFKESSQSMINIALYHGGFDIGKNAPDSLNKEQIDKSGFDYIALGDWHGLLEVSSDKTLAFYSGSPEPLAIDQKNAGQIILGRYDEGTLIVDRYRIGVLNVQDEAIKMTNHKSANFIRKKLEEYAEKSKALRIVLTGKRNPLEKTDDIDFLRENYQEKYFYLQIENKTELELDLDQLEDYPEELLVGRFIQLLNEDLKKEKDESRKQILKMVLEEGIRRLTNEN
jgi:DNA repair protein SbcD/Mre11